MFLPFLPGGAPFVLGVPFSFCHIRGKNGKYRFAFPFSQGGTALFLLPYIRGKNGKNRFCLTVFTGGRFLFQYHIRDQNGKINCCSFCTVLIEGGKRVYVSFQFLTEGHRCFFCHIHGR